MGQTSRIRTAYQVLVILLVGALTPGRGIAQHEEKLLTAVARQSVVQISAQLYVSKGNQESYRLSMSQLLLITTEESPTAGSDNPRPGEPEIKNWKGSADLFDTRTGIKTHLAGLTRLLHRTTVTMGPGGFEASPDGTWLYWGTSTSRSSGIWHAAHLDGTHYRKWNYIPQEDRFFLDDRHLVQISYVDPVMFVRDLQNPEKDRKYRTPEQARAVLTRFASQQPVFVDVYPQQMGVAPVDYARITIYRSEDRLQWLCHQSDPTLKAPEAVETRKIKIPEEATHKDSEIWFTGCEVSPDQKSIFYEVMFSRNTPLSRQPISQELWVSRADGQGLHKIGYILAGPDKQDSFNDLLVGFQWLPNSKQISFFFQGVDYVVDAKTE